MRDCVVKTRIHTDLCDLFGYRLRLFTAVGQSEVFAKFVQGYTLVVIVVIRFLGNNTASGS